MRIKFTTQKLCYKITINTLFQYRKMNEFTFLPFLFQVLNQQLCLGRFPTPVKAFNYYKFSYFSH